MPCGLIRPRRKLHIRWNPRNHGGFTPTVMSIRPNGILVPVSWSTRKVEGHDSCSSRPRQINSAERVDSVSLDPRSAVTAPSNVSEVCQRVFSLRMTPSWMEYGALRPYLQAAHRLYAPRTRVRSRLTSTSAPRHSAGKADPTAHSAGSAC